MDPKNSGKNIIIIPNTINKTPEINFAAFIYLSDSWTKLKVKTAIKNIIKSSNI